MEEIEGGGAPRDAGATVAAGSLGGGFFAKFLERDGGGGLIEGFEVGDFSGGGVVVEGGEFPAESGVEGFGHAESEGDGGGGIGGGTTLLQDFNTCLGGLFTARNNDSCGGVRLHGGGELGRRVEMDDGYKTYPDLRVRRESWKLSTEGHFQVPVGEEG